MLNDCPALAEDDIKRFFSEDADHSWLASKLHRELVRRVNEVILATGAKVVVSSNWRRRHGLEVLQAVLDVHGFCGEIIDVTPMKLNVMPRHVEISWWLRDWAEERSDEPIESWVAIDDDTAIEALRPRAVVTDSRVGMTDDDVKRAIEILHDALL